MIPRLFRRRGDRREAEADEVARRVATRASDEAGVRRRAGEVLGRDFSAVRFQTVGAEAERLAAEGAGAETAGADVTVAPGHYRPDLPLGRALLAHELAHVAQQGAAPPRRPPPGGFGPALAEFRATHPPDALAASARSLAEPGGGALTPAPPGMRQRTISCNDPEPEKSTPPAPQKKPKPAPPTPKPTPAPSSKPAASAKDWNFTPAEHAALKKAGGSLRFGADSDWVPDELKKNLLATLEKVLDPALKPSATEGVNVKDFYHGHVVIPKGAVPKDVDKARKTFNKEKEARYAKALGGESYRDVTAKNLPTFKKAVEQVQVFGTKLLEAAVKVKGAAVIYHTFEFSGPSMKAGDPRRNWKTPLDSNSPAQYNPPDPDNASSYGQDYSHIFQFAFLIDSSGVIHVRPGSTRELTTVTGKP